MQFGVKTVNQLLDIDESYKAPDRLLELVLDDKKRPELFKQFLDISTDMSFDWFHEYFEDEQSERKKKKQDFTPDSIATLMNGLVNNSNPINTYYEPAAGTGGILIKRWWNDRLHDQVGNPLHGKTGGGLFSLFTYDPRSYWYQVEEMSDRAIPFLLFNMAIRGMNGVAIQCDVLTRQAKEVYFIRNDSNDYLAFSEVVKLPHNDEVLQELNLKGWVKEFGRRGGK